MRNPRSSNSVSGIQRLSAMIVSECRTSEIAIALPTAAGSSDVFLRARRLNARAKTAGSDGLPAQYFVDLDALGLERLAQYRDAGVGIGLAAHEDVERRIAGIRPR